MLIHGVIPALITPFDEYGQLYLRGLNDLIDFELGRGVNGLFILGSAGQGPLMTPDERKMVARLIIKRVGGQVPVIVHIGAMPTAVAIDLAKDAAIAGASALSSIPPAYYRHDTLSIVDYYRAIVAATDLPVLIYNNPTATSNPLSGEVIKQLATIPRLVGIKDGSGQVATLYDVLNIPNFTVLIANADLNLIALIAGAAGSVSTISVVVPELFLSMQRKLALGDIAGAMADQRRISAIAKPLRVPAIGALHEALRLRVVDAGIPRRPLRPPTPEETARNQAALDMS